jgi:hypothetical protein
MRRAGRTRQSVTVMMLVIRLHAQSRKTQRADAFHLQQN